MHRHLADPLWPEIADQLGSAIEADRRDEVERILAWSLWGLLFEDLALARRALLFLGPTEGAWDLRARAARAVVMTHYGTDILGLPLHGAPLVAGESAESRIIAVAGARAAGVEPAGMPREALGTAGDALLDVPTADPLLRALLRVEVAMFHVQRGASGLALAQLSAALRLASASPTLERSILVRAAIVHAVRGNLPEAQQHLRKHDRIPGEVPAPWRRAIADERRIAEAFIVVERVDRFPADAEWPDVESVQELWPVTTLLRARQALIERTPVRAIEIVEFATQTHADAGAPFPHDVLTALKAQALVQLAELDHAERLLGEAENRGPYMTLALAHLRLRRGSAAEGAALANEVLSLSASSLAERGEALLLRMWADALEGRHPDEAYSGVVARMVVGNGLVRIAAHLPGWLLDDVSALTEPSLRVRFDTAIDRIAHVLATAPRPRLTPRESVVLEALVSHGSVNALASSLSVSPSTIKSQLSAIYRKLGVSSRQEAIPTALRMGLLDARAVRRPSA